MQETATRIDFYVLETADENARLRFACRLMEKAYKLKHKIFVLTGSGQQAEQMNQLLWTFRDGSFVPHEIAATENQAPIVIGSKEPAPEHNDILVNLGQATPGFYQRFNRVIEVIDAAEETRSFGRQRFSDYRKQGCEPETHKIGKS